MADVDRSEGRSAFGADPAGYDRARPGYPDRLYEILRTQCGLCRGTRAFEIGPGTGQATRQLLRLGAAPLVVVEPDPRLAAYLENELALTEGAGRIEVRQAPFEDVDLAPGSFELGVAATSFHWLDPDVTLAKVARALRQGGWWAMWWNVFGDPVRTDPFHDATQDLLKGLGRSPSAGPAGKLPFALDVDGRAADVARTGAFDDAAGEMIRWTLTLDTARLRSLYATFSEITRLPSEQRERLLDELASVVEDRFGGSVEKPMVTAVYTARRR
jgi:SAM-dependent methyltransferase